MEKRDYVFSDREQEQCRLQSQAELFEPLTERVFRAAGLHAGMRVLDIGSGAGDVAMLAARLVGPDGAVFASPEWERLHAKGANAQRPLWASTGTKTPAYSDVLYVSELVGPDAINTMPEQTLPAFADHGKVTRTL